MRKKPEFLYEELSKHLQEENEEDEIIKNTVDSLQDMLYSQLSTEEADQIWNRLNQIARDIT